MNKATQIHCTEHQLRQIEGNTIVASKKKQKTSAHCSTDSRNEQLYASYSKPSTFQLFVTQLNEACNEGDQDAKSAIEDLAPEMAAILKKHKDWDRPKICLSALPN